MLARLASRLSDPFRFEEALAGLALTAEELPSLTRDARMDGLGR